MTSTEDVAQIAAKLTKAQRAALSWLDGEYRPAPRQISRQSTASLARAHPDLCNRDWQDGCANCTYYRLTDTGLAVRTLLTEDKNKEVL